MRDNPFKVNVDLIEYEIAGSWWAAWIPWFSAPIAKYFVWKTGYKYRRYLWLKDFKPIKPGCKRL